MNPTTQKRSRTSPDSPDEPGSSAGAESPDYAESEKSKRKRSQVSQDWRSDSEPGMALAKSYAEIEKSEGVISGQGLASNAVQVPPPSEAADESGSEQALLDAFFDELGDAFA